MISEKIIRLSKLFGIVLLFALCSEFVFASSGITYHGRLLSPDGTPVTSSSVQFQMQIRTPGAEDCLMYEEIQNLDLSTTSGMFSISLGDGSGARQDSNSWGLFESFSNRKTFNFNASDCNGLNTYTPNGLDNRKFKVSFNDGSFTGWEVLPLQTINYIPMAIESYAVGGFPASSLLRVQDAGTLGTPSALTTAQYNEILALVAGTSALYTKDGELNGSALPTIAANESVRWNGTAWQAFTPLTSETDPNVEAFAKASLPTCGVGEVLKSDGTSLSCVTDAGGWSAVDATTTVKGIVNVPAAGGLEVTSGAIGLPDVVTGGTYTKVTVDAKGRVTTGANITGSDITSGTIGGSTSISTTGSVSAASMSVRQIDLYDSDNSHHISFLTPATTDLTADYDLIFPATLGSSNQVLGMNNAGTALENKSIAAGSGVTITHTANQIEISATGSGGTVTSVTGTSPISVATGTTTPVISLDDAGTAGTYGSATQVPVFTTDAKGRVTAVTNTTITGVSPVGSTLSTGEVWVGDGSNLAQERFLGVEDLKTALGTMQIPTACTSAQTMIWSAVTDVFSCTDIAIATSQVTGLDTALDGKVDVAGDTMTGALNLPINGLVVGTTQLVASGGNVGVGIASPLRKLHVVESGSTGGAVRIDVTDDNDLVKTFISLQRSRSSTTAPGAGFGSGIVFGGEGFTDGNQPSMAGINAFWEAAQTDDTTSRDAAMTFSTILDGTLAEKMRISSSGNVGIGTNNPSTKLEVVGTIKATAFEGPLTATSSSIGDGTAASPSMTFTNDANTGFYSSGADSIGISAGGSQVWNITTSSIVSPTVGGASMSNTNGTAAAPTFSFAGDLDTGWFRPAADTMAAATAGAERVRIDSSGNVGIGTITPGANLHIENSINSDTSLKVLNPDDVGANARAIILVGTLAAGSNYGYLAHKGSGSSKPDETLLFGADTNGLRLVGAGTGIRFENATSEAMRIDSAGNVGIGTTIPTSKLTISANTATLPTPPSAGETLLHIAAADTESTRLVLDSFGTGVAGNSNFTFRNANGTAAAPSATMSGDLLGQISWFGHGTTGYGSSTRATIRGVATENWTDTAQGAAITFLTSSNGTLNGSSERMRIDESGNVGIGTTVPGTKLEVNKDFGGLINTSAGFIGGVDGAIGKTGIYITQKDGTGLNTNTSYLLNAVYDNASKMVVTGAGSVGIGTNNPSYLLHAEIDASGVIGLTDSDAAGSRISMGEGSSMAGSFFPLFYGRPVGTALSTGIYSDIPAVDDTGTTPVMVFSSRRDGPAALTTRPAFQWRNNSSNLMTIAADGEIGIGTTDPTSLLDLYLGNLRVRRNSNQYVEIQNDGAGGGYIRNLSSEGNKKPLYIDSVHAENGGVPAGNLDILFRNGPQSTPTELMRITESGNVGIGTAVASDRLVVYNGSTTGRYTTTGWTHVSDLRLKHDIAPLENSLEKILQLRGVEYKFRSDKDQRTQVGFIAQEVEPVFPEVVNTDENGFKSMVYSNLVAPLVEAVKELFEISEDHSREIASVKVENTQLKAESVAKDQKIMKLEKELEAVKTRLNKIEDLLLKTN